MFCFGVILEKNRKSVKIGKKIMCIIGLLRHNVGNPRRGVDLRQGMGYPCRGEVEVPKWHPSGMPWHRNAVPRCNYYS